MKTKKAGMTDQYSQSKFVFRFFVLFSLVYFVLFFSFFAVLCQTCRLLFIEYAETILDQRQKIYNTVISIQWRHFTSLYHSTVNYYINEMSGWKKVN